MNATLPLPALLLALDAGLVLIGQWSVREALDTVDTIVTAGALALALRGQGDERRNDG